MTHLKYDAQGFIIGLKRIEQKTEKVHHNTQQIVDILLAQKHLSQNKLTELTKIVKDNKQATKRLPKQLQQGIAKNYQSEKRKQATKTIYVARQATTNNSSQNQVQTIVKNNIKNNYQEDVDNNIKPVSNIVKKINPKKTSKTLSSKIAKNPSQINHKTYNEPQKNNTQQRDSAGRFAKQADEKSFIQRLSDGLGSRISDSMQGVNDSNIDPLIDSFNEIKGIFSPISKSFGLMKKFGAWSLPKIYRRKRNEPLPKKQEKHNERTEKLLAKLIRRIGSGKGNGLFGGLLKGLFGRKGGLLSVLGMLGKSKLFKGGRKLLGPLGALIGIGSLVSDWDSLDKHQKASRVGELSGGLAGSVVGASIGTAIFPGLGTVVGAVLGGWLGSEGGEALGDTVAPYIEKWTSSLTKADLPKQILSFIASNLPTMFNLGSFFGKKIDSFFDGDNKLSKLYNNAKDTVAELANKAKDIAEQAIDAAKNSMGIGSVNDNNPKGIKPSKRFKGFGAEIDGYIREASSRYGIGEKDLRGFVKMEDGWTGKMSPTGAIGVGQFTQGTWNDLAKTPEGKAIGMTMINRSNFRKANDPRHNKRINTLATALLAKKNAHELQNVGIETSGENLYMAHNMGLGFVKAIYGKGTFSKKTRRNMDVNGGKGMTQTQFMAYQKRRYLQHYVDANNGLLPDTKNIEVQNNKLNLGATPTFSKATINKGITPTHLPSMSFNKVLPKLPKFTQQLNNDNKPIVVVANNQQGISQNVSDRAIAHAVTGGLGDDRFFI